MVCDLILKGEIGEIKEVMAKSENIGMRTFDAALYHLYKDGRITLEEALRNADSPNNLRLRISLEEKGGDASWLPRMNRHSPRNNLRAHPTAAA